MNNLIIYASKHGATKTCATYLFDHLPQSELKEIISFQGDVSTYNMVFIGSCVYMGQFNKHIKTFLTQNQEVLLQKDLVIFFCAMNDQEVDTIVSQNLSKELLEHASIVHAGGAYDFRSMNFLERFVVKKMAKVSHSVDAIQYNNLDDVIKKANQ